VNEPPQHDAGLVGITVRILASAGGLTFLIFAIAMGTGAFHARRTGELMSNWKNGTMPYQAGFIMTAVFLMFSAVFFYSAIRPNSIVEHWNKGRK
jgi:hypothetical protein